MQHVGILLFIWAGAGLHTTVRYECVRIAAGWLKGQAFAALKATHIFFKRQPDVTAHRQHEERQELASNVRKRKYGGIKQNVKVKTNKTGSREPAGVVERPVSDHLAAQTRNSKCRLNELQRTCVHL